MKNRVSIRLRPSLLDEARRLADDEGVGVDRIVNIAVAEKLSAIRTEAYFKERADRADVGLGLEILARAGVGNEPAPGDEIA